MNIVREQRELGTSLLKITVSENDYKEAVEKSLKEYKRKANVPGFRPGMVPMGVVKKMFGKGVLAEQSYRTATDAAFNYLKEEGIDYLGDIIPSEEQGAFDFDNQSDFDFVFEFGEAPAFNLELTAANKINYSAIAVDDKMRGDFRTNYLRRFGRLVDVDTVESDEALSVTLTNSEMTVEDAYVGLISMSEEERAPFIGKTVGYKCEVNVEELYKTPSQRAAILQVKEEELAGINPQFELEITKIRKFAEPEINEEFFKMAFPEGEVSTEEAFNAYIDEQISSELRRESDYLFTIQLRNYILEQAGLQMPVAFLKRWLVVINEGKFTMEDIEKDFDQFLKMYTWNYIQKQIITSEEIKVETEQALEEAKAMAQAQFAQYGMPQAPADMLQSYAEQILSTKEQAQRIYEKLYETQVVNSIKSKITVEEVAVSADEFAQQAQQIQ